MNIPLIEVTKEEAFSKLHDYKSLNDKQWTHEDDRLTALYKAVSKGARVVNIANAFKVSGLNEKGQPRLAIARADWKTVYFHPKYNIRVENNRIFSNHLVGAGLFTDTQRVNSAAYAKSISLPGNTFINDKLASRSIRSSVPHIPPALRPTIQLKNFHILFEVENWEEYPVDPYLLRHIEGHLYIVVGEWELTPLEASLLGGMIRS